MGGKRMPPEMPPEQAAASARPCPPPNASADALSRCQPAHVPLRRPRDDYL